MISLDVVLRSVGLVTVLFLAGVVLVLGWAVVMARIDERAGEGHDDRDW